jgi:divalent metal cation (Fe/Co/Zn/Cd) transporter
VRARRHRQSSSLSRFTASQAGFFILSQSGYSIFDPLMAGAVALWIIATTAREVFASHDELIWPEKIVCGHSNHEEERAVGS